MDASRLNWLSAADAARAVRDGAVSAERLVDACLARIRESEPQVQAWQHLDPEHALAQARALDERHRAGESAGPLHGVPVGIKDIIDTADMPTEDGCTRGARRITTQPWSRCCARPAQ
jgi:Asp-tRNA(Asn)/Glu-tRNA(Gln) amidotransferase A subunit family amidase